MNLDQELCCKKMGRVTVISARPIELTKLNGVAVLVDDQAKAIIRQWLLSDKPDVELAQALGVSNKLVSRIRRALGLPMAPREGTSKTTAWRRKSK